MTKSELRDYIKRQLGCPPLECELTDDQLNDAIDEAVDWYADYGFDGSERKILLINVKSGATNYDVSEDVLSAIRPVASTIVTGHGINTLFTAANAFWYNGTMAGQSVADVDLVSYSMMRDYIELLDQKMIGDMIIELLEEDSQIRIYPTPISSGTVAAEVYMKAADTYLYTVNWVRRYATAAAKMIWGAIGSKFDGELPTGATLTIREYYDRGKEEKQELLEELTERWTAPVPWLMG